MSSFHYFDQRISRIILVSRYRHNQLANPEMLKLWDTIWHAQVIFRLTILDETPKNPIGLPGDRFYRRFRAQWAYAV